MGGDFNALLVHIFRQAINITNFDNLLLFCI